MNKIYKLKYCTKSGAYVAVSEVAKGKSKTGGKMLSTIGVISLLATSISTAVSAATEIPAAYYSLSGTQEITIGDVYKYGTDMTLGLRPSANIILRGEDGGAKINMIANETRAAGREVT